MFDEKPWPVEETIRERMKRLRMGKDSNLIDVHEPSITQCRSLSIAKLKLDLIVARL
jgi:hypothetical protein